MKKNEEKEVCLTLMEKVIKGYSDTAINEDVCATKILDSILSYESHTANLGNLDKACVLADMGLRQTVKHNFLGYISSYLYDVAWNKVEINKKNEDIKKELKCAYLISCIQPDNIMQRYAANLYEKVFGGKIDEDLV